MLTQDAAIEIVRAYTRDIQNEGITLRAIILMQRAHSTNGLTLMSYWLPMNLRDGYMTTM
jgi:hypothetical protein